MLDYLYDHMDKARKARRNKVLSDLQSKEGTQELMAYHIVLMLGRMALTAILIVLTYLLQAQDPTGLMYFLYIILVISVIMTGINLLASLLMMVILTLKLINFNKKEKTNARV